MKHSRNETAVTSQTPFKTTMKELGVIFMFLFIGNFFLESCRHEHNYELKSKELHQAQMTIRKLQQQVRAKKHIPKRHK